MGCYRKYLWKILLIFGKIKLFLEKKGCRKPYSVHTHTHVCVCTLKPCIRMLTACARMHGHAYATNECMDMRTQLGFQKLCKESFLYLILVWNKSHIIWKSPQTPIFQLYKAIKGTFLKEDENGGKTHKFHQKIMNQKGSFSQNILKSNFV